ncbi:MAG: VOC family protein [bacterium]|nr:VOC family protein [bacterium]
MSAIFTRTKAYQNDAMNLPVASVDDAIPFYASVMGFTVESQAHSPVKSAILYRKNIRIGLAEIGGDPTQDGCFFEVDDVEAAFDEFKANGLGRDDPNFRVDKYGDTSYKVFFVVAPDGLCYCLGQRVAG